MDIEHIHVDQWSIRDLHLKVIIICIKSMVIRNEISNLMQNIFGYLRIEAMHLGKVIQQDGITTLGSLVSYVVRMDILQKTVQRQFRGKNWKIFGLVYFHYKRINHLRRECMNQTPIYNNEESSGKVQVIVEDIRNQMNQSWKKTMEEENSGENKVKVTQSNGEGDHTTSN